MNGISIVFYASTTLRFFLCKISLPNPSPLDNCFTITFFFMLSLGTWFSFPHWKCLVTFEADDSITLCLQFQVQIRTCPWKVLHYICQLRADGSDDLRYPRLQQLPTEKQLKKFRPLSLPVISSFFSLLLLKLSLLKACFEIKPPNYTSLHISKVCEVPRQWSQGSLKEIQLISC